MQCFSFYKVSLASLLTMCYNQHIELLLKYFDLLSHIVEGYDFQSA